MKTSHLRIVLPTMTKCYNSHGVHDNKYQELERGGDHHHSCHIPNNDVVGHLSNHNHHHHHDRPQNYDHHDVHNVVCHCHHHDHHNFDHHLNYYHHHHESIMITTPIMTTITRLMLTLMCTMLLATEIQESRAMLQGSTAQVTLDKRKLQFLTFVKV